MKTRLALSAEEREVLWALSRLMADGRMPTGVRTREVFARSGLSRPPFQKALRALRERGWIAGRAPERAGWGRDGHRGAAFVRGRCVPIGMGALHVTRLADDPSVEARARGAPAGRSVAQNRRRLNGRGERRAAAAG